MHWFWKLVDEMTPDQQILFLILLKPALVLASIGISASIFVIWWMW